MNQWLNQPLPRPLKRLHRVVLDTLLPPECVKCRAPVADPGNLCGDCFYELSFITEPHCIVCGVPFETEAEQGSTCGSCLAEPPAYDKARAVFVYDEASRPLILKFKHADRTEAAPFLASWMVRAGQEILAHSDQIFAVPLHRRRLLSRQYNQAALLARQVAQGSGLPFHPAALRRTRDTGSQGGRSRSGRARNVEGAFAVAPDCAVKDQSCLLIDDVLTTGATASACARALKKAGAREVNVLTVARVPLSAA